MKRSATYLILIFIFLLAQCSGGGGSGSESGFPIRMLIQEAHSFNTNSPYGKIAKYKVLISGDALQAPIIHEYEATADKARITGVPHNSVITVEIQALNQDDQIVRRGLSDPTRVAGGQLNEIPIIIRNVPIFANLKDGQEVLADRFIAKVFAPGGIPFQLSDVFDQEEALIQDPLSGNISFSIAADNLEAVMNIQVPRLSPGPHRLTVKDPQTGEFTAIHVTVWGGTLKKVLPTTAGGWAGTPVFPKGQHHSDWLQAFDRLTY